MTVILALDLAMRRTGWAVGGVDDARPRWGVYETHNWCKETCDRELTAWRKWIEAQHATHRFDTVAVEEVFVNANGKSFNFKGTQFQMMASGVLFQWCHERGVETFEAGIDGWRERFLGLNRKPKDFHKDDDYWKKLALKVAAQRNWFCEHHDEAEALGILDFSLAALSKPYRRRTDKYRAKQHQDIDHKMGAHS